jgi:hypothetical protein
MEERIKELESRKKNTENKETVESNIKKGIEQEEWVVYEERS